MKIGEKAIVKATNKQDTSETYIYTLEVVKSGCFNYGNGTAVVIKQGDYKNCIDTRYCLGTFEKFVANWITNNLNTTDYKIETTIL